jgi:predicted DCC family thiol-disulfide oxidoreductase YuxK
MKRLFVVYDPTCGLCSQIKDWLARQPAYVPLYFVPSGLPEVQQMLPGLPPGELAVVSEEGEAWIGNRAWILCLWALREYRGWSARLARPALLPFAQQAFELLSRNRSGLSSLLGLRSDAEMRELLNGVTLPSCPINPPRNPPV